MNNIDQTLIWSTVALISIFFVFLIWRSYSKQQLPRIDVEGPASRRYPLDRWDIVGYVELDKANTVDRVAVKKAQRVKADVIAYERPGIWIYLKRARR